MSPTYKTYVILCIQAQVSTRPAITSTSATTWDVRPPTIPQDPSGQSASIVVRAPGFSIGRATITFEIETIPYSTIKACESHWTHEAAKVAMNRLMLESVFEMVGQGKKWETGGDWMKVEGEGGEPNEWSWWEIKGVEFGGGREWGG